MQTTRCVVTVLGAPPPLFLCMTAQALRRLVPRSVLIKRLQAQAKGSGVVITGYDVFGPCCIVGVLPCTVLVVLDYLLYPAAVLHALQLMWSWSGAVSTVCSWAYNLFSFLVLGRVAVASHAVLKLGKTLVVTLSAVVLMADPISIRTWSGILVTMMGQYLFARSSLATGDGPEHPPKPDSPTHASPVHSLNLAMGGFTVMWIFFLLKTYLHVSAKQVVQCVLPDRFPAGKSGGQEPHRVPPGLNVTRTPLCYLNLESNSFGHQLGPLLIQRLLGDNSSRLVLQNVRGKEQRRGPCLFGVGTILADARPRDAVWGSGLSHSPPAPGPWGGHTSSNETRGKRAAPRPKIYALRGPKTHDLLVQAGQPNHTVVYGDPLMLVARLFPEYVSPEAARTRDACFLLHPRYNRVHGAFLKYSKWVMYATMGYDVVIPFLLGCRLVVSSSLSGIVVAEAYGIPTRWLHMTQAHSSTQLAAQSVFKFCDYYAATGRGCEDRATSPDKAVAMGGKAPIQGYDYETLLKSFPYALYTA